MNINNLKRLVQSNDATVRIEGGAVVVGVDNGLLGGGVLPVLEHNVQGRLLPKDGKAASCSEDQSVRDESTRAELENLKMISTFQRKAALFFSSSPPPFVTSSAESAAYKEEKRRRSKNMFTRNLFILPALYFMGRFQKMI